MKSKRGEFLIKRCDHTKHSDPNYCITDTVANGNKFTSYIEDIVVDIWVVFEKMEYGIYGD